MCELLIISQTIAHSVWIDKPVMLPFDTDLKKNCFTGQKSMRSEMLGGGGGGDASRKGRNRAQNDQNISFS